MKKLICLLFLAMLLFQTATICYSNPIKLNYLSLVENRYFFTTLGNVLQTISTILLVSFILLIADLINRISLNYSIFELLTKYKISLGLLKFNGNNQICT
ncbi:hypothetical protein MHBO_004742 [Bonamia ostreae]|uniref:Uncharacterized protein n=1 Tax=Bonamia ostreae TaxID=126728 RepID=A0ABV2AUY0_9EUKA